MRTMGPTVVVARPGFSRFGRVRATPFFGGGGMFRHHNATVPRNQQQPVQGAQGAQYGNNTNPSGGTYAGPPPPYGKNDAGYAAPNPPPAAYTTG